MHMQLESGHIYILYAEYDKYLLEPNILKCA